MKILYEKKYILDSFLYILMHFEWINILIIQSILLINDCDWNEKFVEEEKWFELVFVLNESIENSIFFGFSKQFEIKNFNQSIDYNYSIEAKEKKISMKMIFFDGIFSGSVQFSSKLIFIFSSFEFIFPSYFLLLLLLPLLLLSLSCKTLIPIPIGKFNRWVKIFYGISLIQRFFQCKLLRILCPLKFLQFQSNKGAREDLRADLHPAVEEVKNFSAAH